MRSTPLSHPQSQSLAPAHSSILRRLALALVCAVVFVLAFVLLVAPMLYSIRVYTGYLLVGRAVARGDMTLAREALRHVYLWRGGVYVVGALVYAGVLMHDRHKAPRKSEVSGGGDSATWTRSEIIELIVCGVMVVYGGVLLWYGW